MSDIPNRLPRDVSAVAAEGVTLGAFREESGKVAGVCVIMGLPDGSEVACVLDRPEAVDWWVDKLTKLKAEVWPGARS